MQKTIIALAILLAPLAFPESVSACSCLWYENDDERFAAFYEHADLVFQGVPIEVDEDEKRTFSVSVEKVWKGQADAYIDIVTEIDSATCGIELPLDERVIIFSYESDGTYRTGLCSGTSTVGQEPELVDWLNDYDGEEEPNGEEEPPEFDCSPYECANGDIFPACENGYPISYLVAPCQFSGGEKTEDDDEEQPETDFSDVPESHPNFAAITFVKSEGIVQGYDDGTYKPEKFINRAEFTKIIVEANFTRTAIDNCDAEDLFSDVLSNDWFAKYVCMAKEDGIIDGYPNGTFQPSNLVNFAEAAKIVVGAFAIQTNPDDHLGIWWRPYVFALARIGGLPTSFTDPNQQLTRGDMAEIIYRVMMGMEV